MSAVGVLLAVGADWCGRLGHFHAHVQGSAYRSLLTVEPGDFSAEVDEISFGQIPMLDDISAQRLGDRKLGELDDMVSQFEFPKHIPRSITTTAGARHYLEYGDIIKWFNNRSKGLPAYIVVEHGHTGGRVVRLSEGIKYSPTEKFGRNLYRHLRFSYPTYMFSKPIFEVDESGRPTGSAPSWRRPSACSAAPTTTERFWLTRSPARAFITRKCRRGWTGSIPPT
jgi:hypothetical protein